MFGRLGDGELFGGGRRWWARVLVCAIASLLVVAVPGVAVADWKEPVVGALNVNAGGNQNGWAPRIASVGGVPYVTWYEANPYAVQIYVKKFSGGVWSQVGTALNVNTGGPQNATDPSIADVGGVPYVAWVESNGTADQVYVKKFSGGAWTQVGTSLNVTATQPGAHPRIANVGGVPYVTWAEEPNGRVYVKKFTGSAWTQVGTELNVNGIHYSGWLPSIADVGGVPYVAWSETSATTNQIYVKQFSGSAWSQVGAALNVNAGGPQSGGYESIASVGGVPYVTWVESNGTANQVYVKQFTGSAWTQVGTALNVNAGGPRGGGYPSIADVGGVPYVTWEELNAAQSLSQVYVKQFSGSAWTQVGTALNLDASQPADSSGITSVGGVPYVTFTAPYGGANGVFVKRFEPDVPVAAPPTASIATPASGATYALNQVVNSSFSCTEGAGGPGIKSCLDQAGRASGAAIDTSTTGPHTFTVTATSSDGLTGSASVSYTVAAPPTASITTPVSGAAYARNQVVNSSFSCTEGAGGPGIKSCLDQAGNASGAAIDTSTTGPHTFTVTATSSDGLTGTASVTYTVNKAPTSLTAAPQFVLFPWPPTGVGLFNVSATLSSGGQPLAGRTIMFTAGGTPLCSAPTGANGTANCTLSQNGEWAVLSGNRYTASFAGDANYLGSTASTPAISFGTPFAALAACNGANSCKAQVDQRGVRIPRATLTRGGALHVTVTSHNDHGVARRALQLHHRLRTGRYTLTLTLNGTRRPITKKVTSR